MTTNKYGWEKITNVQTQLFTEPVPCGDGLYTEVPVDGYVWIETAAGVFSASPRPGETLDDVAEFYRARLWTDDRCVLAFPAKQEG